MVFSLVGILIHTVVVYLAVVQGSTSAGQAMSFGPSKLQTLQSKDLAPYDLTDVAQAFAAAKRIKNMRQFKESINTGSTLLFDHEDEDNNKKERRGVRIELRDVWFKYPTRDVPVLQGLNMIVSYIAQCDCDCDYAET